MKKIAAVAAVLALVLALAASQIAPASTAGPATASKTVTVSMKNFKFHPKTLNVSTGTTVVFANNSKVTHTATEKGVFDTGKIKKGHSAAVRFKAPGTYKYFCKIHPEEMRGKIIVG